MSARSFWPPNEAAQVDYETLRAHALELSGLPQGLAAARFGWADENPYLTTITGVLLLMLPVVLARFVSLGGGIMFPLGVTLGVAGFVIEYLAWTVGFGAVALMRFRRTGDSRTGEPSPAV